MPCYDPREAEENRLNAEAAKLTCEAMTVVESHNLLDRCSPELRAWWEKHRAMEDDEIRRAAAKKLHPRELLALGIRWDGKPMPGGGWG